MDSLRNIASAWTKYSATPDEFVEDGDTVVVLGHVEATAKTTGTSVSYPSSTSGASTTARPRRSSPCRTRSRSARPWGSSRRAARRTRTRTRRRATTTSSRGSGARLATMPRPCSIPPPSASTSTGLVPVVIQDWTHRRGPDARLRERGGGRAHARDRRAAPVEPLARTSCGTRARRAATRRRSRRCGWTATATRCSRSSSPPARRATPARGRASTTATLDGDRAARGAARASSARCAPARPSGPRAPTPSQLLDDPALIGEKVRRRPRRSPAPRARRPTTASTTRPPTSSTTCMVLLRSRDRDLARRRGGAAWPSPLTAARPFEVSPSLDEVRALARDYNVVPLRTTFIDDVETPVSAFLKLRGRNPRDPGVPARVAPSAARSSGATRSSASARGRSSAGASATPATRTRSPPRRSAATARRRSRTCRRSPAARWGSSATTSCAPSRRRSASRTPTRSACRTWRSCSPTCW